MATSKFKIGVLVLAVLLSSIYILLPENVKLSVSSSSSTFYVWENGKWNLSGTETSRIMSYSRGSTTRTQTIEGLKTSITRTAEYSTIKLIDNYLFSGDSSDRKTFPIEETHRVINGNGAVYQYDFIGYDNGQYLSSTKNSFEFGKKMKVTWQGNPYYMKITKLSGGKVKLTLKYSVSSDDETFYIRMFDPDTTAPLYSLNMTNSTRAGRMVKHSLYWTDETNLSGYIFSFDNGTGSFTNDSFVSMLGTGNWSNVSKNINSTVGTAIRWRVYTNDTSNNTNVSLTYSYTAGTPDSNCSFGSGITKIIYRPSFDVNNLPNLTNIFYVNATGQNGTIPLFSCNSNGTSEGIFRMSMNVSLNNVTDTCGTSASFANALNLTTSYQNIGSSTVNGNSLEIWCRRSYNSSTFSRGLFQYNLSIN